MLTHSHTHTHTHTLPQERQRILKKFPESHKLQESDEKCLQETLKKAQEKVTQMRSLERRFADEAEEDLLTKKSV